MTRIQIPESSFGLKPLGPLSKNKLLLYKVIEIQGFAIEGNIHCPDIFIQWQFFPNLSYIRKQLFRKNYLH